MSTESKDLQQPIAITVFSHSRGTPIAPKSDIRSTVFYATPKSTVRDLLKTVFEDAPGAPIVIRDIYASDHQGNVHAESEEEMAKLRIAKLGSLLYSIAPHRQHQQRQQQEQESDEDAPAQEPGPESKSFSLFYWVQETHIEIEGKVSIHVAQTELPQSTQTKMDAVLLAEFAGKKKRGTLKANDLHEYLVHGTALVCNKLPAELSGVHSSAVKRKVMHWLVTNETRKRTHSLMSSLERRIKACTDMSAKSRPIA